MTRLLTLLWLVLATFALPAAMAPQGAWAQSKEEIQMLDKARTIIKQVETDQPGQANNFSGLLDLREKLGPVRDELGDMVEALQQKLAGAKAQLSELGPDPAAGASEGAQQARDRKDKQQAVRDYEAQLRTAGHCWCRPSSSGTN